jgi:uncharacterized membrane protein YoaK (UPF0700 family)
MRGKREGHKGGGKVTVTAAEVRTTAVERRRGLFLAMLLAGLAGMVDAIGFIRLGHLFVSYMSGNSTQFAIAIGRGHFDEVRQILVLIVLFIVGAAAGQLLYHAAGRRHLTVVLALVAVLLAISAVLDTAPLPMVIAMGALNAAMHRAGGIRVNLTFVTGTLVRFGAGIGDLIIGRANGWGWAEQAVSWVGLVCGAIMTGAVQMRIGSAVDWMPVAVASVLFLLSFAIRSPE